MKAKKTMSPICSSQYSHIERDSEDYYATDPKAIDLLLNNCTIFDKNKDIIWESACGEGHLSKRLIEYGFNVYSTDLIDRKYGEVADFYKTELNGKYSVITNPPFNNSLEFVKRALYLECVDKVALFLRILFLETKGRYEFFMNNKPNLIIISSTRIPCYKNGKKESLKHGSAAGYAWYIWDKTSKATKTELTWGLT